MFDADVKVKMKRYFVMTFNMLTILLYDGTVYAVAKRSVSALRAAGSIFAGNKCLYGL